MKRAANVAKVIALGIVSLLASIFASAFSHWSAMLVAGYTAASTKPE
jgi:hypothetical protein